jgi:hypothetical protein
MLVQDRIHQLRCRDIMMALDGRMITASATSLHNPFAAIFKRGLIHGFHRQIDLEIIACMNSKRVNVACVLGNG